MCESCKHFMETYPDKGWCSLWDNYVKSSEDCEDYKEE